MSKKLLFVFLCFGILLTGCETPLYHVSVYGKDSTLVKEYREVKSYYKDEGSTILYLSNNSRVIINSDMVVIEEE